MKKLTKIIVGVGLTLMGTLALAQCDISNLSVWDVTRNNGGMLDVTANAAMGGTACGLAVETMPQPTGQDKHWVQDGSPNAETRYRAAFCLDLNGTTLPTSNANRRLKVHMAQCTGCANTDVVQFKVQNNGGQYQLNNFVRDSNIGNTKNKSTIDISNNAPVRVEYDLDITAGTYKVWINATSESDPTAVNISGLDIAAWPKITRARLGSMDKSAQVTPGQTFYIDEFESRRQTFIGGTCN